MTNRIFVDLMTVATAIIGLAIIAVIVSKQADTGNVISKAGTAFGDVIKAAVSPLSGNSGLPQLPSLPGQGN
jgi:PRD1 phage membrane DNA delivery